MNSIHWNYFLELEKDFLDLSRYIEPTVENYKCYSIELARLLMATVQECDVVFKEVCKKYGNDECVNEEEYRKFLSEKLLLISEVSIYCRRSESTIEPYSSWKKNKTPKWWTANNNVKHNRRNEFSSASLANFMHALSGLFVLNLYLISDIERRVVFVPETKCFFSTLEVPPKHHYSDKCRKLY